MIEDATSPAAPAAEPVTAEHHANWLHEIFTALDEVIHVAASPEVLALLSPKFREYAIAAVAVDERIKEAAATPAVVPSPAR